MSTLLYRPQDLPKKFIMQERLLGGGRVNYNFCNRTKWYPAGWKFNKITLGKMHAKLHYLAWHAPKPIQKKYKKIYDNFSKIHFGSNRASVRYLNKYSCHSWM